MKKVLVYPCGTEIGLEIYRALCNSIHYEVWGGSCSYDHGRFVYDKHIDNMPFIRDNSSVEEIVEFNNVIKEYGFDYIYPAMDGVLTVFSKYREHLSPVVIAPDYETTKITRSKKKSYEMFKGYIPVPEVYENSKDIPRYPIFVKPDVGQGSVGAMKINSKEELLALKSDDDRLLLELLPGEEYTIDCFTNGEGTLVYCRGRIRKRIKSGISVSAVFYDEPEFEKIAKIINAKLNQRGGWFFQLKRDANGQLKLLEIASRIAGTSAIQRNIGVNLPLLTLNVFAGHKIDDVIVNSYNIELDRALANTFKIDARYDTVYIDYDDTIVKNGVINTEMISFLYQCVNNHKKIILISKHKGDLKEELVKYRLEGLFDEVCHIAVDEKKKDYIVDKNSIFIDDSYGERLEVYKAFGINVFDTHMIECLLEG